MEDPRPSRRCVCSLLLATLPACGLDTLGLDLTGSSQVTASSTDTTSVSSPTSGALPATSGVAPSTSTGPTPTLDLPITDGSATTATSSEGSTSETSGATATSTTEGDTGDDCDIPADDADADDDTVANAADNCRCDANPNQLDFDGDAIGNVCDEPLVFVVPDGAPPEFNKLDTTAKAGMSILSCQFPVSFVPLVGNVQVTLDDAGLARIWVASLAFADTPEAVCDLTLLMVKLRLEDFIATGPDPFVVQFPFTLIDHAVGVVTGQADAAQSILVDGIIAVTESSNPDIAPVGDNPIAGAPGSLSLGQVTALAAPEQVILLFDDPDILWFTQTTRSGFEVELTGLHGNLQLRSP